MATCTVHGTCIHYTPQYRRLGGRRGYYYLLIMERRSKMGVKKTTISANHASREFLHKLNELRWNKTLVDIVLTGDSETEGERQGECQVIVV